MKFKPSDFANMKKKGRKIIVLTAYDAAMARIQEEAGVDILLVGDSLGNVIQGNNSTRPVTMDHMAYHTEIVRRGAPNSFITADMPYRSYENPDEALKNAKRLMKAGADAVKYEGLFPEIAKVILGAGIPIMGHLGLLPQTAEKFAVQGKQPAEAVTLAQDAQAMDKLGFFSIVLECVPESLADSVSKSIKIPTIGIGAGKYADGQVLVVNDMLGFNPDFTPKFLKRYADLHGIILEAVKNYSSEVQNGLYPDESRSYH